MKKNILITLLIVLAVAVIVSILNSDKYAIQKEEVVQLPTTVFDATATVPGTRLTFSYPSNGFYGHGADISTNETKRYLMVESESPYMAEKGSEFVILNISVQKPPADQRSLEDFIRSIDPESVIGRYIMTDGEYKEINGIKFFLAKVAEDAIIWHGWTLVDGDIITITLAYKASTGLEPEVGLLRNDQLFLQILETVHLQ